MGSNLARRQKDFGTNSNTMGGTLVNNVQKLTNILQLILEVVHLFKVQPTEQQSSWISEKKGLWWNKISKLHFEDKYFGT